MNELINLESLQSLINYSADPSVTDLFGRTPLHYSSENKSTNYQITELLLSYSDPNEKAKDGLTPFHISCSKSFVTVDIIKL